MAHQITINWNLDPTVSGYNVYRGTKFGNESKAPLNATLISGSTFTDNSVFPGQVYIYEVTSVLNGIESTDSLEITAPSVPQTPSPALVDLGSALTFAALGGTAVVNTAASATVISGDVGASPGSTLSGFGTPAVIAGVFHAGNYVSMAAQSSLVAAMADASGRTGGTLLTANIGGQRLAPGVYMTAAATALSVNGVLVLDGHGDPNSVWIFQCATTLATTASNSTVVLVGSAQPANVFWYVGTTATLGANTVFQGNIMAQTSVTLGSGTLLEGRAMAVNGAVNFNANEVNILMPALGSRLLPPSSINVAPPPPPSPNAPTGVTISSES